jgi:hypothetical protein
MEALEVVDGHFAEVKSSSGVKGDYVGIYGVLRQAVGLQFENRPMQ